MPKDAIEWYERNLNCNIPRGKLDRGMSVVNTAEIIKGTPLMDNEYLKAAMLSWGIELLQAFFLISDDMMDSSIMRRGQPCWYRAVIYYLLKMHFRGESYYVDILELFLETTFQTEMGQLIDLITAPENEVDLSKFSLKKHPLIVIYRTAYHSFHVPQSYPSGNNQTIEPYALAKSILIPLSECFQIQDDCLDFSGMPEQIRKIGTDILDNKCSWCVNTALSEGLISDIFQSNWIRKDSVRHSLRGRRKFREIEEQLRPTQRQHSIHEHFPCIRIRLPHIICGDGL
ncbi:isoprenoid synthase domain-containing protein [Armillaria borealis]|uniref:(2E,6E)-farnesyl diphosphate synthase n=1 Tax=Armillaria borealis TaxID=47425 RepID=A0AA39M545_9AGAR|nr:isoprenoid synthase domain-containing protein [Armillaria borealis]